MACAPLLSLVLPPPHLRSPPPALSLFPPPSLSLPLCSASSVAAVPWTTTWPTSSSRSCCTSTRWTPARCEPSKGALKRPSIHLLLLNVAQLSFEAPLSCCTSMRWTPARCYPLLMTAWQEDWMNLDAVVSFNFGVVLRGGESGVG